MSKPEPDSELGRVGAVLSRQPDMVLAFAIGSVAAGDAGPDSDIDIAVLTTGRLDAQRTMELIELIVSESGRPVDLIDLREGGTLIGLQVLEHGVDLYIRSLEDMAAFNSRTIIDAADFLPIVERALEERLDKWTGS